MEKIREIINRTKAYYCVECGKCTAACPLSRYGDYSPDRVVERALIGLPVRPDLHVWSCLTCGRCKEVCTYGVDYPAFIRQVRSIARDEREQGICAHGELFSVMRLLARQSETSQKRLYWLSKDLKVREKGDILYFTGCLPYFDIIFRELGVQTVEIARSTVRILNMLGIVPVVMDDEVCCGHDLLWNGEVETFNRLAALNMQRIARRGAKKLIFSCPEGYRTFKLDYPSSSELELVHISELLAEKLEAGTVQVQTVDEPVTYHDPCRLGRHLGIYDPPRRVLSAIAPNFVEMASNRENSLCCGTSGWTNCDSFSEAIRRERLGEASETGAKILITSCPKCLIHFTCHLRNRPGEYNLQIVPFELFVARALGLVS